MIINVELPCNIGDEVFVIIDFVDIPYVKQEKVIAFELWNKEHITTLFIRTGYGLYEYKKKAFLIHKEAEEGLKR